jgi:putative ABC transport system ATP-binding protein
MLDQPRAVDFPVAVRGLNHWFGEGESRNQVLHDNTIEIQPGQLVIMTGPSGSGKTTLLTLIGALRSVMDGSVRLLGWELKGLDERARTEVRRNIGFIFQLHNLFDSLTAYENVKMAMQLTALSSREMHQRGTAILEQLGLGHRVDYKPKALSGGQRQRVAIARALVNKPSVILADEPTAALDKDSSRDVVDLLKELAEQDGCTILMVTHDNRIIEAANRIVNMVDGSIVSNVVVGETVQICEFLHRVEPFRHLSPSEITHVAEQMKKRSYRLGSQIIRQGDEGDEFFLMVDGEVEVTTLERAGGSPIATLGPGEFFGEAALISGEPRNATVTSRSDVTTYVLDKKNFNEAIETSETFKEQLLKVYFHRQ